MSVILCRAAPVDGDPQDENVVRVYHNHTVGISGISVEFEGERREVRRVSRQIGQHGCDHTVTILAHFKRRRIFRDHALHCQFIDDLHFMTHVRNMKSREAVLTLYYGNDPWNGVPYPRNLLLAKLRQYHAKGWLSGKAHRRVPSFYLSDAGHAHLKQLEA